MPTILRDHGLSALVAGELETVARGLTFTEGPLWLPDGTLLFQDLKANRTHALRPQGALRTLRANRSLVSRFSVTMLCSYAQPKNMIFRAP